MPIKLVVGLGNPGKTYAATRHNVGYRVIDALKEEKWTGMELFKPSSSMNLSGGPVAEIAHRNGFSPKEILVICDDFALPLGSLRMRLKGSSGGQNGLESVLATLGTQDVPRLRLGIGPLPPGQDAADFVLTGFKKDERPAMQEMIARAAGAVKAIAEEGFETAVTRLNTVAG
jgi:PTH1 family peptidyl-tRNA hydrolase